jgi:hypothetical protein
MEKNKLRQSAEPTDDGCCRRISQSKDKDIIDSAKKPTLANGYFISHPVFCAVLHITIVRAILQKV